VFSRHFLTFQTSDLRLVFVWLGCHRIRFLCFAWKSCEIASLQFRWDVNNFFFAPVTLQSSPGRTIPVHTCCLVG
jgi:hypothetical protein